MTFGYLIDLTGAIMASLATAYLIFIRVNRRSIMSKHEKGTPAYDMYSKLFNPINLIATVAVALFFIVSLASDIRASSASSGEESQIFILVLIVVLFIAIFFSTFKKYKKE